MFFSICLYSALAIFCLGMLYRLHRWFYRPVGQSSWPVNGSQRFRDSVTGVFKAFFSPRLGNIVIAFVLDVLLQRKLLKESFMRWLGHFLIFGGFIALLFMHAMESIISVNLFTDYQPTLQPYLGLRNILGLAVCAGIIIVIVRRLTTPVLKRTNGGPDWIIVGLLAVIIGSGFFLEAAKIISQPIYSEMVNDYASLGGEQDAKDLKAYWAKNYGVVFGDIKAPFGKKALARGAALHQENCASCHSEPNSAIVSYPLSRMLAPAAPALNDIRFDRILWYIHFLACMLGLAYLPFSKLLHVITTPLALLIKAGLDEESTDPAVIATRRALELDACTHCAICSEHCSVSAIFKKIPNLTILPSEKLAFSRQFEKLSHEELSTLAEGSHICTLCLRCTGLCPAGINLQELWIALKDELRRRGIPSHFEMARGLSTGGAFCKPCDSNQVLHLNTQSTMAVFSQFDYSACFRCSTCTNSCPVVRSYDNPKKELGLLPHQIIHSLALGMADEAMSAAMTWDCLTCYTCQEYCPQQIPVADLLYELRQHAFGKLKNTGTNGALK